MGREGWRMARKATMKVTGLEEEEEEEEKEEEESLKEQGRGGRGQDVTQRL